MKGYREPEAPVKAHLDSILKQLDGRTVGLIAYNRNNTNPYGEVSEMTHLHLDNLNLNLEMKLSGEKRLCLAKDDASGYHIDIHVEVSGLAYLTLWKGNEKLDTITIYDCDDAPRQAIARWLT
jgi:hypothetical protein